MRALGGALVAINNCLTSAATSITFTYTLAAVVASIHCANICEFVLNGAGQRESDTPIQENWDIPRNT